MPKTAPLTDVIDANQLLAALVAFKKGDFGVRLAHTQAGAAGRRWALAQLASGQADMGGSRGIEIAVDVK